MTTIDLKRLHRTKRKKLIISKRFAVFLITVFLLTVTATWIFYAFFHLTSGRNELYEGRLEKAYNHFLAVSSTGLFQHKTHTGFEILKILYGDSKEYVGTFAKTDRHTLDYYDHSKLLERLIRNSRYKTAYEYSRHLIQFNSIPDAYYYGGIAATALGKYEEAADLFLALSGDSRYHIKAEEKLTLLGKVADDSFYSIRDRNGGQIAKSFSNADLNGGSSDYLAFIIPLIQIHEKDLYNSVILTIDNRIQHIAENTLEDLSGILIAVSPGSGDILAIAADGNCLENEFYLKKLQPGFLVNIVTAIAAGEMKADIISFPMECPSEKKYGDVTIYSSHTIEPVRGIQDAIIYECNAVFSESAIKIGKEKLCDVAKRLWFDRPFEIGEKKVNVASAEIGNDPDSLALFTNGYHRIWTTPLHLAMIASSIASNGAIYRPRLVLDKRNIDGNSYFEENSRILNIAAEESTINPIKTAMSEIGRKMMADSKMNMNSLRFGMLYTYSGGVEAPFSWILIGFYPADNPRIAFSLILSDDSASKEEIVSKAVSFISKLHKNRLLL